MDKFIQNILLIIAICFVAYLVFRSIGYKTKEGLEGMENSEPAEIPNHEKNYGGNASVYASNLKNSIDRYHDKTLIHKYRPDYENVIMHLDDLTNHLMLQTAMNVDHRNPDSATDALNKIANLNNSKAGLNNVMKFIDGQ